MSKIIAYCGLICSQCDVYKATINNDNNLRLELVKKYSTNNHTPKIEDFYCEGCFNIKGDGCEIRKCAVNKNINNCATCDNYSCDKLNKHFESSEESRNILDDIRGGK